MILTDTLPQGSTYVSSTQGGQFAAGVVTWRIGDLQRGQRGSVQVTVTFGAEGTYVNRFQASHLAGNTRINVDSNDIRTIYSLQPPAEGTTPDGGAPDDSPDGASPDRNLPDIPVQPGLSSNCQPPNLLILLDRSGSMRLTDHASCPNNDCTILSTQSCTQVAECSPMSFTKQPAPGTSPVYQPKCEGGRCKFSRWDVAQNALKEAVYEYGGTSAQNFRDRKIHFGLVSFNQLASVDAAIVSDPPQVKAILDGTQPTGGTHYTNALLEAQKHLRETVDRDPLRGRPTHILLLTDGEPSEGCQSPRAVINDLYTGTGPYRLVDKDGLVYPVKTYVLGFGSGITTSARSCLGDLAQAGGTRRCDPSVPGCVAYYAADNDAQLRAALDAIINNATQEICDGIDNDCNGLIDDHPSCQSCQDGQTRACYTGSAATQDRGSCKSGVETCQGGKWGACVGEVLPQPELCDGLDNDCDGAIDNGLRRSCQTICGEGTEICRVGRWEACSAPVPTPEICDGIDNNCDGTIDEGCDCTEGSSHSCYTGPAGTAEIGACKSGLQFCINGKWASDCRAEVVPITEVCNNGIDDNCDGQVDEGCAAICQEGETRSCPATCGSGTQRCTNGAWQPCTGVTTVPIELCDGQDNDCDGKIDENLIRACQGACSEGLDRCVSGQWTGCQGRQPKAEVCSGFDDDCDGKIDEEATCPNGAVCIEGLCPQACRNAECPAGFVCQNDLCLPRITCAQANCKAGEVCQGGRCVDSCTLINCSGGMICWQGRCGSADCYTLGCPSGQICQQGVCVLHPCNGVSCDATEACKGGRCVGTCEGVTCGAGQRCLDGLCQADACAGVACSAGTRCLYGECFPDPCVAVTCPTGRVCQEGGCVDDPCRAMRCPDGWLCQAGQCTDACKDKTCPAGQSCYEGICRIADCYHTGCPDRKICQEGRCIENPCEGKRCAADAFCRLGVCVASCLGVTCKQGERCRDGACEIDRCAALRCPVDQVCFDGQCVPDLCKGIQCGIGRICQPATGQCEDDPCLSIQCPTGSACRDAQCVSLCDGVNCPQGFLCDQGICITRDCYTEGCPSGQRCWKAVCEADPYKDISCPAQEFCRDGKCVKSCAGVTCPAGESCRDGLCQNDPCAAVNPIFRTGYPEILD